VYDRESEKVGTVDGIDRDTGWLMIGTNPLATHELYIPVCLITSIDPRELYLSATRSELTRDYRQPPPRSTIVSGVGDEATATTTVGSGYDGAPVVIHRTLVDVVGRLIVEGDHVVTADGTDVGVVKHYDATAGVMLVDHGVLVKHDLLVATALVDDVVRDQRDVHLVVTQADLRRLQDPQPVDVVATGCPHLNQIGEVTPGAAGCEDCLASADTWRHLQLCTSCGHVGCSDDSRKRHATRHFRATRHPIMRSFEPGESWGWCYVDQVSWTVPRGASGPLPREHRVGPWRGGAGVAGSRPARV
jgi:hypothetical protein